ncbi:MAG: cupin domain-containing protein [Thermoleophilia bacterium]|nr:cupin domain-containing protein [Thermoleophilia bacterium]
MAPKFVRKSFEQMDARGGGVVKLARKSLGVSAFGIQVFDFPPGASTPLHDESPSGQEEVYVGLAGSGWVEVEGERVPLEARTAVFVPPGVMRTTVAGPEGLSFLAVGAAPHPQSRANPKFD